MHPDKQPAPSVRAAGPQTSDWVLLAIGIAFCLAAIVIWPSDWRRALVTLVFFGACTAVAAHIILRKLRARRFHAAGPANVAIAGSVDIPISRTRAYIAAAGIAVIGAVLAFVEDQSKLMNWLGAALLIAGIALIAGYALGRLGKQYLRFEPAGIVFGERRYRVLLPWDAIREIATGEYHNNAVVLLWLTDLAHLQLEPESERARLHKRIGANRGWVGADFYIMSENYALPCAPLAAALQRYIADPLARAELTRKAALPLEVRVD